MCAIKDEKCIHHQHPSMIPKCANATLVRFVAALAVMPPAINAGSANEQAKNKSGAGNPSSIPSLGDDHRVFGPIASLNSGDTAAPSTRARLEVAAAINA